MRSWLFALDIVFEPVHQLAPTGIADGIHLRDRLPALLGKAEHSHAVLGRHLPGQPSATTLRMVPAALPNDELARLQILNSHAENSTPLVEAKLRRAPNLIVGFAVGSPPAAQAFC